MTVQAPKAGCGEGRFDGDIGGQGVPVEPVTSAPDSSSVASAADTTASARRYAQALRVSLEQRAKRARPKRRTWEGSAQVARNLTAV